MKDKFSFYTKLKAFSLCALFGILIFGIYILLNLYIFIKENVCKIYCYKENKNNDYSKRINKRNKYE